jgi:NADH dehydrogenase (ubiquinone) Fe-S protein 4
MTSGRSHIKSPLSWSLEFDNAEERWENPMIGWTSSRDTINQVDLRFQSSEDAVRFAQKNGWNYTVRDRTEESLWKEKAYANNFKYSVGKLRFIPTK